MKIQWRQSQENTKVGGNKGDATEVIGSQEKIDFEKLATPDTTVADLIEILTQSAANEKLSFSDDRVIHYGMIPPPIANIRD